jgi:hypothetical protein
MKPNQLFHGAAALALLAVAGCDGGTTGPAEPASMVAVTPVTQTAVVAGLVPVPPAVRVSDNRGRGVAGVQVNFGITTGEGSVSAHSVTDAGGVAVATGWMMSTVAQEHVLTASVPGVAPVEFRVTAMPGAATALQKAGGDEQSAAAGTALADSISVRVVDQYGNGVPGMMVNFTTSSGLLSATRATTAAQGHARVGLVVPTRPGPVQVHAGMGALEPQVFQVMVTHGPAAAIARLAGDGQTAYSGTAVAVAPAVHVTDAFGNPVSGSPVVFTPAPGSGVVMGGVATTGADGRAQVGSWVLGEYGANHLMATLAGVDSVQFTAISLEPCGNRSYTLFTTVAAELLPNRCTVAGRNAELFSFTVPTTQCIQFEMTSSQFDTYLYVVNNAGTVLAQDDDGGSGVNSLILLQLSPGTYFLGAAAFSGGLGTFQLHSQAVAGGCGSPPFPVRAAPDKAP